MDITFTNFPTGTVSWDCVEEGQSYGPYSTTLTSSTETLSSHTCYDAEAGGSDYVTADGVTSNTIATDASSPPPPPPPPATYAETVGGVTHTWTDYSNAGGIEGPSIPAYTTVQVACAVQGFRVADGDTWWYRIASSPWSDSYYASADAFYNNGQTSGSLKGTPFVDPAVPAC
jgi:hypothetical protein